MKIEPSDIREDIFCNECHAQNDVKRLYLTNNIMILCKDCRKKLIDLLESDINE